MVLRKINYQDERGHSPPYGITGLSVMDLKYIWICRIQWI